MIKDDNLIKDLKRTARALAIAQTKSMSQRQASLLATNGQAERLPQLKKLETNKARKALLSVGLNHKYIATKLKDIIDNASTEIKDYADGTTKIVPDYKTQIIAIKEVTRQLERTEPQSNDNGTKILILEPSITGTVTEGKGSQS
jgi:hypothetical protein